MNAPRAAGPRRTPRPERDGDPAMRAARPQGRPSSLPPPGFAASSEPVDRAEDADDDVTAPRTAAVVRPPAARPASTEPVTAATPAVDPKRRGRRGRRVKRVIRRIDLWSVLKLSLVVYACVYAALMGTLAAVWGLAYKTGTIDKLESFLADVGMKDFHFYGDRMFKAVAAIGAVGVLSFTVITVLATALVNVISELTGGIRLTVIEEDV